MLTTVLTGPARRLELTNLSLFDIVRLTCQRPKGLSICNSHLSLVVRKPAFCICENKDADQLHGDCEADQLLCFHYIDSTIPLLPKYEISSL